MTNVTAKASLKSHIRVMVECFLAFAISTFCVGLLLTHRDGAWIIQAAIMLALYLFVIILSIKRLIEQLPIPALMLLVPIAPLAILILVVSILPILQKLQ